MSVTPPTITLSLKAPGVECKHAFSCSQEKQAGEDFNLNQFSSLLTLISHIRYLPIILRGTLENVDSWNNFENLGENYRIVRKVKGIFLFLPSLRTATTSCEL